MSCCLRLAHTANRSYGLLFRCVIRLERQEEVDEELQEMTDTEAVQEELLLYFAESDATSGYCYLLESRVSCLSFFVYFSGQDCRQNHNKILKMRQDLFREQAQIDAVKLTISTLFIVLSFRE